MARYREQQQRRIFGADTLSIKGQQEYVNHTKKHQFKKWGKKFKGKFRWMYYNLRSGKPFLRTLFVRKQHGKTTFMKKVVSEVRAPKKAKNGKYYEHWFRLSKVK